MYTSFYFFCYTVVHVHIDRESAINKNKINIDETTGNMDNARSQGITLQSKNNSHITTKVRGNTVVTQNPVVSKNSAEVHYRSSLENDLFTPVVHNNRFWPLINSTHKQEEKVIINEVQGDKVLH